MMQKRPKHQGKFGYGHEGHSKLPDIQPERLPAALEIAKLFGHLEPDARAYRMGQCTIMVGSSVTGWHLSIAHPNRYPTWDEVAKARYALIPHDVDVAMMPPKPEDYINVHTFCFQMHQVRLPGDAIAEIR